jgi:lipopolysaccharide transport system ATP-binding protein
MTELGDAIILKDVVKSFKKTSKKSEFTTIKSEVVRILQGKRKIIEPATHIEALRGINLNIKKGRTTAIVGRNGSGKSTLLKLITGIYSPTSGSITVNGRISALLELGAGFHPDFTGRENIFINGIILGMSRAELKDRAEDIIAYAELGDFIDEPVRSYSSGMFMRLAFAVATHVDPEILIIDEILSVGDEHFQRKSQAKMDEFRKGGKTILLVTHGLGTVETWCDEAAWIDGGKTRMVGNPTEVVREYKRAIAAAESEIEAHGSSALSTPGLALPQSSKLIIPSPQLTLNGIPVPASLIGTEKVRVDVNVAALNSSEAQVTLRLLKNGQNLFSTSCVRQPNENEISMELQLPGLSSGWYEMEAVIVGNGISNCQSGTRFEVAGEPGTGLLELAHQWRKDS